jgi:hypothetical protein
MATGVPQMHGGGNCLGSSNFNGSGKSDVSSQGDPSELSPAELKPAQQISAKVVAGQPNLFPQTDPTNPGVAGEESENQSLSGRLRGGSADLEITNVAKFFAGKYLNLTEAFQFSETPSGPLKVSSLGCRMEQSCALPRSVSRAAKVRTCACNGWFNFNRREALPLSCQSGT